MLDTDSPAPAPTIVLDLYDTLAWVDWRLLREGRSQLAERARVDVDCLLEQYDATVAPRTVARLGGPEQELARLLEACGAAADDASLEELAQLDRGTWRRGVRLFEDVTPGILRLRGRGCRLGIVSNCTWQGAEVVQALGLDRHVDAVVLSFEAGVAKPDPAMLALVFERLEVPPAGAVLVDDLVENLDAARDLGARTLLMDRSGRAPAGHHRRVLDLLDVEAALFP